MTIGEAIKRLTNKANESWNRDELKDADACQLGIEALKRTKLARTFNHPELKAPLPGETEEQDSVQR